MDIQLICEQSKPPSFAVDPQSTTTRLVTPGEVLSADTSFMRGEKDRKTIRGKPKKKETSLAPLAIEASLQPDRFMTFLSEPIEVHKFVTTQNSHFSRGHGSYIESQNHFASVAGYVTRVNRLITVTPLRQVYQGAIGDTIVGRITQVQSNKWKVAVNSRLDAELRLANIHLPGGEQRRKNLEDERGMRDLLCEGDLICVEVQKVTDEGLLKLAARTSKFGKLSQGTFLSVSPSLIVQDKQRIHDLPCGARVIFGANGYIFILPIFSQEQSATYVENFEEVPVEARLTVSRLYNCIKLLAHQSIMISLTSVVTTFDQSLEQNFEVKELLKPGVMRDLALATVQLLNEVA